MKNLKKSLAWEVLTRPIIIEGLESPTHQALVRSDDGSLLSIKSNKYNVFTNKKFQQLIDRITSKTNFKLVGFDEFNNGKRILAFLQNPDTSLRMVGQKVKEFMVIGNSNDGSSKMFIGTSSYMIRCENQFSEKIRSFEKKHTADINPMEIDIDTMIVEYEKGRKELYDLMEALSAVPIGPNTVHSIIHRLDEQKIEKLEKSNVAEGTKPSLRAKLIESYINREMKDLGRNYWGLFNGITRYTSSELNSRFGNTSGRAEQLNREALQLCLDEMPNL